MLAFIFPKPTLTELDDVSPLVTLTVHMTRDSCSPPLACFDPRLFG